MKIEVKKAIKHHNKGLKKGDRNMTKKSLAEAVGVTQQTIQNLEIESTMKVDISLVIRISEATGCPLMDFVPQLQNRL